MKSIKYFAALAFPAMLAACANEDIQVESPQTMNEVVGAELIGTDISLKATTGNPDSRYAGGEQGFGKSDKLGLAWATITGPSTSQTEGGAIESQSRIYANHLFEWAESDSENTFVTKSNIYKGYHFAYYPYTYMEAVGPKTIEISPKQEVGYVEGGNNGEYNQRLAQQFQMSAFQFLDRNSLDENYQLKRAFAMKTPLSQLVVKTTAEGSFATNENLKEYPIKSVTFNLGKEVFAHSAKLDLTKLHKIAEPKEGEEAVNDEEELLKSFANVLNPVYPATDATEMTEGRLSAAKTEIAVEGYTVSANNPRLITFVLPMAKETDFTDEEKKAVSIEIEAGGGKFIIDYTNNAEEGTAGYKNNQALEKLVAAYEKDGTFVAKYNKQLTLDLVLTEDDFVADFTGVNNDNWAEKVQLADDLNRGVEEFILEKGAEVIFEGKNLDADGKPLAPKAGVKVTTVDETYTNGTLTIRTETEWNDKINVNDGRVGLKVEEGASLKVNSELAPSRIFNYGTIYAGPVSTVGKKHETYGNFLLNYNRVEVEYGAYVNVDSNTKGIIAYALTEDDVKNPSRVKDMIATSGNEKGHANVNTLVVGQTIDIDLYKNVAGSEGSTEEGRYNDTVIGGTSASGDYWIESLEGVSLEINGGKVKASYKEVTVANITMNGGNVENIIINGDLTIEGGTNNVNVGHPQNINGDVTIKDGNSTVYAATILGNVTAKGENAIHANGINGSLTVEGGRMHEIHVGEIMNGMTVAGDANIVDTDIRNNVDINAGTSKMTNINIFGKLTNNATVVISGNDAVINDIENKGTLTANTNVTVSTIVLNKGCTTTVNEDNGNVIWYTTPENEGGYVQAGTTTGQIKYLGYDAEKLTEEIENAAAGATVILKGDVTLTENLTIDKDITIDLNGKTLTTSAEVNDTSDDITVKGNLKVENGTVNSKNTAFFTDGGNLTLVKCNVSTENTNGATAVSVTNGGHLVIIGGTFTGKTIENVHDRYVIGVKGESTAVINNATVSDGNGGVTVIGASKAEINGGSYKGLKACGLYIGGNSQVTYTEDCTFEGNEGAVVVKEGTVNGTEYTQYTKLQ